MSYSALVVMTSTECTVCSAPFQLPKTMWDRQEETGGAIFCPAGHKLTFGAGSLETARREAVRLRAQLDQAKAHAETLERSRSALRGEITKVKRRIGNGVCPCCNRHFANVERHMASKHPDLGLLS